MSMLPPLRALSTIAVLPSPWLCAAVVSPPAVAVCLMISPRMYDSVKRLDPTLSVAAPAAATDIAIATSHIDEIIFATRFQSIASPLLRQCTLATACGSARLVLSDRVAYPDDPCLPI